MKSKTLTTLGGVVLMCLSLNACAPLMVAGFAGTAIVASDRRTSGAQLEDETIELRGSARIRDALGEKAHVNVTSFNRMVLLTGEGLRRLVKAAKRIGREIALRLARDAYAEAGTTASAHALSVDAGRRLREDRGKITKRITEPRPQSHPRHTAPGRQQRGQTHRRDSQRRPRDDCHAERAGHRFQIRSRRRRCRRQGQSGSNPPRTRPAPCGEKARAHSGHRHRPERDFFLHQSRPAGTQQLDERKLREDEEIPVNRSHHHRRADRQPSHFETSFHQPFLKITI